MGEAIPADDPLPSAGLAAYLRGWWAGALSDAWPITPPGLCPLLEARWEKGVHDGRLSRIRARRYRVAQPRR